LIAILAFCAVFAFSCKKDSHNPAENLFIGATKKNTNWQISQPSTSYFANRDSLMIQGVKGEEGITFKIAFHGKGTYQLKGNQAIYFTTLGQDVITSQYQPDATKINTLTITNFNIYTNVVTGNFELNLKKIEGTASLDNALSFTNGKLWVLTPPSN
jgi:hypothetical protein